MTALIAIALAVLASGGAYAFGGRRGYDLGREHGYKAGLENGYKSGATATHLAWRKAKQRRIGGDREIYPIGF